MYDFDKELFDMGSTWTKKVNTNAAGLLDLVTENGYSTLKKVKFQEEEIARFIFKLMSSFKKYPDDLVDALIKRFEENENLYLHSQQKKAVKMIVNSGFCVLTGGPGTGKTFTIRCAISVLTKLENGSFTMIAPSAKAAVRMTESTNYYATTIHKKLGLNIDNKKKDVKAVAEQTVFVDECSMLGMETAYYLLKAISSNRRVIFIGDINQLPSVSPGAILRDLIDSNCVPCCMLTKTFRQEGNSVLLENIKNISKGKSLVNGDDFRLIYANADKNKLIDQILTQIDSAILKWGLENICVLIPYRKSKNSRAIATDDINKLIQEKLNPGEGDFRKGDYVMQLVNRSEVANGEIGQIESIDKAIKVKYADCFVSYSLNELDQLTLAYAMSVHKSQGSEYSCVIMVLLDDHANLLQRNLLYTGVSRAKKECILICDKDALNISLKNASEEKRITRLKKALKEQEFILKLTGQLNN